MHGKTKALGGRVIYGRWQFPFLLAFFFFFILKKTLFQFFLFGLWWWCWLLNMNQNFGPWLDAKSSNLELNWMLSFWPRVAWGSHGKDAKSTFSYGIVYRSGKSKRKSCRRKLIFIHQVIALPLPEPSLDKEGQEVKREELIYPRTATSNTFSSDTDLQRSQDLN